jgi:polar amino acid transport system ATP-binding protein
MTEASILRVSGLRKAFGGTEILKAVDFDVQQGETVVVIGPSGSGKSTLLRCINGLVVPNAGRIWLQGSEIFPKRVKMSEVRVKVQMVFQHFNLFNHLKVIKNVSLGPRKVLGLPEEKATKVAMESLEKVGMQKWLDHYPGELSGGQQQRVAIARALAMKPSMILFDEPTSALDPELIGEVLQVMEKLSTEGLTNITVTHEIGFARAAAKQILFLCDGVIMERGPPEKLLDHPEAERTRKFLSKITE